MKSAAEWDEVRWIDDVINGAPAEAMHIVPVQDLVGHELTQGCICGPHVEHLAQADYLIAHHPLDIRP